MLFQEKASYHSCLYNFSPQTAVWLISMFSNIRRKKKKVSDCGSSGCSPRFSVVITGGEYQFPSCLQFHFSFKSKPRHLGQWCTAWSHSMELLQEQSTVRGTPSTSMPCSHKRLRAAMTVLSGFCCWLATLHLALDTQAMMQLKQNLLKKWTNSRKLSSQPNEK